MSHAALAVQKTAGISAQALSATLADINQQHLPEFVKAFLRSMAQGDEDQAQVLLDNFPEGFTPEALASYKAMPADSLELLVPGAGPEEDDIAMLAENGIFFEEDAPAVVPH